MTPVVGVHGIWNHKYFDRAASVLATAQEEIGKDWARWLARGVGRRDLRIPAPLSIPVAYYADCLDRGIPQDLGDDPELLPPLAQELLVAWVEQLRALRSPSGNVAPSMVQGEPTWPVAQAASWLTRRLGNTSRKVVTAVVTELGTYFDPAQAHRRQAARDRVAETIRRHRPRVLVAHSLGSVVAYETLCGDPDLRVELLVTLGSPLGMPSVVFDRLEPAPSYGRGMRPPGAPTWTNIADIGDPVAVPPGRLAEFFDGVDQHHTVRIRPFDPHTAKSYLGCTEIADTLAPYLYA